MLTKREIKFARLQGNIKKASLLPSNTGSGFVLEMLLNSGIELMCTEKKQVREFKSLDSAFKMINDLGMNSVELKVSQSN